MTQVRKFFALTSEPSGELYQRLLTLALEQCRFFLFVVRSEEGQSERTKGLQEKLHPYLVEVKRSAEWPGTILFGGATALVHTFDFNEETQKILTAATERLYEWRHPDFPEDLCLLRPDRSVWMGSTSHECACVFELELDDKAKLVKAIPELDEILREANFC